MDFRVRGGTGPKEMLVWVWRRKEFCTFSLARAHNLVMSAVAGGRLTGCRMIDVCDEQNVLNLALKMLMEDMRKGYIMKNRNKHHF